jgi:N-acyl-L-homoserine lactone synthetase
MSSVAQSAQAAIERGNELLNRVDYRLVETAADREAIYRLRYRAYIQEGAIVPRADRMVHDQFDDLPNTWIFAVYLDGALASSIRVTVASAKHPTSPSVEAFPDLLRPDLAKGKIIVDPTRFVAEPTRAKRDPELPYLTVRLGYMACAHFNADIGLATVRAEHAAFYRRVFLQKMLTEPRLPPGMAKPVCVMAADYHVVRDRIYQRYPYFRTSLFERRALFERHHALPGATRAEMPQQAEIEVASPELQPAVADRN